MRQNSRVWKKVNANMLLHQKDDFNKKGKKLEERDKTTLLPNATH